MASKTAKESRMAKINKDIGRIVQIIGPVVDVEFPAGNLPEIFDALEIKIPSGRLVLEVQQHLGSNQIRTISLGSTDGLKRNMQVIATGKPITVPVGTETLGRIFNVIGETIDSKGEVRAKKFYSIHRPSP